MSIPNHERAARIATTATKYIGKTTRARVTESRRFRNSAPTVKLTGIPNIHSSTTTDGPQSSGSNLIWLRLHDTSRW
jgi:hypothetical protein